MADSGTVEIEEAENQQQLNYPHKLLYSVLCAYSSGITEAAFIMEIRKRDSELSADDLSDALSKLEEEQLAECITAEGVRLYLPKPIPLPPFEFYQAYPNLLEQSVETTPQNRVPVQLISVFTCNSFSVRVEGCSVAQAQQFRQRFSYDCELASHAGELVQVKPKLLNVGDCCIFQNEDTGSWERVRVIDHVFGKPHCVCYLVDEGRFVRTPISALKLFPRACVQQHPVLASPKQFELPVKTMRCFLDPERKSYNKEGMFPCSRNGLLLALRFGQKEHSADVDLKLQILSRNEESDFFTVKIFNLGGAVDKLEEAVAKEHELREMDRFFSNQLDLDEDANDCFFESEEEKEAKLERLLDMWNNRSRSD